MNIITIDSVHKFYGRVHAVDNLSLSVKRGEIFGLLGPNGAGKTTTLHMLEGLLQQDSGEILLFDETYDRSRAGILSRIGVQLQSSAFIPELKVLEQIIAFRALFGKKEKEEQSRARLADVGLEEKADSFPEKLSGGQKQRLGLVLALVNDPEILFLDEPSTGLDPQTKILLWGVILRLQQKGVTVVLTTHNIEEAETVCTRVGIINKGRLVAMDTPSALIGRGNKLSLITVSSGLGGYDIIRECTGTTSADYNGKEFKITTTDVVGTIQDLFTIAGKNKTYLGNLHIKQPSLEDIFLELTGHQCAPDQKLTNGTGETV